ncbi:MAG: HAMP domain-containing histidine kinase [Clostridia bacterium]|nr:HAMP domain-containing histidine kinase [Clostridia bacterium]
MKFKTIGMRIWVIFTAMILLIVSTILILYYVVFSFVDSGMKEKDLTIVHETILEGNYSPSVQFDTFQNLRGSTHFVFKDGQCLNIMEYNRSKSGDSAAEHENSRKKNNNMMFPPGFDMRKIEEAFAELAEPGADKLTVREKVEGRKFIVVVSEYDGGYLISSVPYDYDNRVFYLMLIISGVFIIIGFIVSKIVATYISKPIKKLEEFTGRVAVKDFSEPLSMGNTDEFGRLADSMNKMQDSLRRAEEEEKQFLQSISHDLKTPVMVIMSHADAIIDGVYVDSVENTAQIIKDEAVELNKKIRELLYFNTLDYVLENQTENDEINLSRALSGIVNRLRHVREDITFETNFESCMMTADPEKITTAFENIIENAIRYAKSTVSISIKEEQSGKICIDIFNDGEPIRLSNINRIFDNLYKDKKGNFGLGLAITKKIISFYDGTVKAENTDGGVNFRVVL